MSNPTQGGFQPGQPQPGPQLPGQPQPAAQKNWFARHKILTAILAIVVIGGIYGASQGQGSGTSAAPTIQSQAAPSSSEQTDSDAGSKADATTDTATTKDAADDTDTDAAAGIGTPVKVGDFEVTVTSVDDSLTHVGPQGFGADASGKYVAVNVTVKNNGSKAADFLDSMQTLIDDQGREMSASSDSIYLENNVLNEQINPGTSVNGTILYDVSADTTPAFIKLSDTSLFGRPVTVSLK